MSQCRRVLRAYVPARFADPLTDVVHLTADTFTRFVTGQLIEACILGGLCAAGMLFIQADYAPLIGVIIGASAIIPVAGAYIGAIVSALLLVMVSPIKALVFLVFLVVLQQIEGNVIYPKVVGTSIGLPGIWVLAAVTIGRRRGRPGGRAAQRARGLGALRPAPPGCAQASGLQGINEPPEPRRFRGFVLLCSVHQLVQLLDVLGFVGGLVLGLPA